jgi:hypothetical protein
MKKISHSKMVQILLLLGLLLAACGGAEPQQTAVPVISGPDIRPTDAGQATPTLRSDLEDSTGVVETAVPTEILPTDAPPTAELLPTPLIEQPTLEPTIEPTAVPVQTALNGLSLGEFLILPPNVRDNVRAIYAQGQALGRNPNTFSILGDSLIATPQSLAQLEKEELNLGEYAYLQPTLDQYAGSFGRYGPSVRVGLHSWSVFDPLWADKELCLANEDLLACEIRLNNPSVMLIFLGSNDAGVPGGFKLNYEQVVQTVINNGIVPILATKADRFEGPDNANNTAVREVAAALQVPLFEFDILANTLPGRGLGPDNVHLTFLEPPDYSSPGLFAIGYPVHNLATLMVLDEVRRDVSQVGG